MKLATLREGTKTIAVRIDADVAVPVGELSDVGALLALPDWAAVALAANGAARKLADIADSQWAPVVPNPGKIICVGLNYRNHILEMGRELPSYPTLFAKYSDALIGAYDDIAIPTVSDKLDWEGELAVIVGRTVRHADRNEAREAIAGYAVLNDVTVRDYQYRTTQWLQGKTFEATTPFGPYLVTADALPAAATLRTSLDGEDVQSAQIDDLLFGPAELIAYISTIMTLRPGDVIATGTPGGVGHARKPERYLFAGATLETSIDGLGSQRNSIVREKSHGSQG